MYNNSTHRCYPDFELNGQFIEIKGNHLINKTNGKWILPTYQLKRLGEEKYIDGCNKMEAKHQCLLQNNVKIIYAIELKDLIKKYKKEIKKYKYTKENNND